MSEENTTETVDSSTNEDQQKDSPKQEFSIPTEAAEFVGQGKKYQSVEDALSSVPHAQKHIQTLESELAEVKDELTKRKTTKELLDEIKSGIVPTEKTSQPVQFNQDNLEQLVGQALENREVQKEASHNAKSVASRFTEQYGDKAEEVYNSIAKENGLPVIEGSEGGVKDIKEAKALSKKIGFPVLIKASAGGGGKGMKIVNIKF